MLGDNPENAVEIELYNPWDTDNKAYDHTLDLAWEVIHIGWEQAVKEGRTTKKFVMQQKKDLLPLEFTVLYESLFPEQSEDSIFSLDWIKEAEQRKYNFQAILDNLLEQYRDIKKNQMNMSEGEYYVKANAIREELKKFRKVVACDPAEKGLDETVMVWGIEFENKYQVVGTWSEAKSEPMRVVGKMVDIAETFIEPELKGFLHIDRIGIGSGPLSRLKEIIKNKNMKNIRVLGCHYGEKAMKADIFQNKKAENWFSLASIMQEGLIDIPEAHKLRTQLISEKWERTSSNKKRVIDPENKSPDWGDALVYFVWRDKNSLNYIFV